jgi:hypothetical protein
MGWSGGGSIISATPRGTVGRRAAFVRGVAPRSHPTSDTNRTYTSEVRLYQHSSLARLVREGQSEALVESGLLQRFCGLQGVDEMADALHQGSDVVLGEHRSRTAPSEILFGPPALRLDLADPPADHGGVGSGLERLPVAGESGVTVREGPAGGLRAAVFFRSGFLSLGECADVSSSRSGSKTPAIQSSSGATICASRTYTVLGCWARRGSAYSVE